ncbi:TonB-dependent receptor plug domain-containing protein [Granulicella arctica]|uniref:TonB-dependent receptor plug domain-containing protein n=1 Tax=Granulicella arctica TaxID=940613 RepID=UPI0021E012F8|nr:TonB-dependent receptor [Granulicella arctica]
METTDHRVSTVADGMGAFALDLNGAGTAVLHAYGQEMNSASVTVAVSDGTEVQLVLSPSSLMQDATVTATRSGVEMGPAAVTQSSLSSEKLTKYPALTLDESLRQHAGFELFRRSSGWIQNPTSQGVSLRGLGSTAVSRTLILANSAPLNDPFGGWIHWNELPPATIEAVTITSGGGSDLYGSSALGGVIDIAAAHPQEPRADVSIASAGEDTRTANGRGDLQQGKWHELAAGEDFRTAGYILTAPAVRGPVDVPANVHFENGRVEVDRTLGLTGRAFVTGNLLNEARGNGTPVTTNGTRLWRYLAGDDWSSGTRASGRARLFGSDEAYRQRFSSLGAGRRAETLTRVQKNETQELGASTDASFHLAHIAFVGGADVRDIRAGNREKPATALQVTTSRQRFIGGFGEVIAEHGRWSGAASIRVDSASNLDTTMFTGPVATVIPNRNEIVSSPRVGVVRQLSRQVSLHGSGFRAFRTPTMNELYRTGQVGQETTQANPKLVSERATGAEGGVTVALPRVAVRATYFWTEINRPVAAVVISSTATSILEMRQNLGQIQSQGIETSVDVNEGHGVSGSFGYQYAHAVVTKFSAQPTLVGNWIPDVAREIATAQLRFQNVRFGELTLSARNSGRAFDDSANTFVLHSFFQLDVYGERRLGRGFTAFVSGQNLLDRRADVARTPVLTQGIPFIAQGGVRYGWGARNN